MKHILAIAFGLLVTAAVVQSSNAAERAPASGGESSIAPLPPEASVAQTATVNGRTLRYHASAGAIPVFDGAGKKAGEVSYLAYTLDGEAADKRPVTFAFGGGPGSSSSALNIGAMGPKRFQYGTSGNAPSDPLVFTDNPASWLGFTDLVFIDPIGTGFSRSFVSTEETQKDFYGVRQDVEYLSGVVYEWLKGKERMTSPKYVAGESYGGYRTPRIVQELTYWRGVGVTGLILLSPYLDTTVKTPTGVSVATISPMSWAVDLPSMAAAKYEREGKTLTPELMREVEDFTRGDFISGVLKGPADPQGFAQMIKRVAGYTGVPEAKVRELGGKLDQGVFVREVFRDKGLIGSRYDINDMIVDSDPYSDKSGGDAVVGTFTAEGAGATEIMTHIIGWKAQGRYWPYDPNVPSHWDWGGREQNLESVSALKGAMSLDPRFKVFIGHGWTDLSCPYFVSRVIVDQMAPALKGERVTLKEYPGGHLFYTRLASAIAFRDDAAKLYGTR